MGDVCVRALTGSEQRQQRRTYDLPASSSVLVDEEDLEEWGVDAGEEVGHLCVCACTSWCAYVFAWACTRTCV